METGLDQVEYKQRIDAYWHEKDEAVWRRRVMLETDRDSNLLWFIDQFRENTSTVDSLKLVGIYLKIIRFPLVYHSYKIIFINLDQNFDQF
jgi:hypothetical protein